VRLEGWEGRLVALIADARGRTYELGTHDCFRTACRVVEALTGVDRWPEFSGYRTPRDTLKIIASRGASFKEFMDWFSGAPAIEPRLARRGDVVSAINADGDQALGVALGARAAFLAPGGLSFVPLATCLHAWRVG
jgi:hypothetical protein